MLYAIQLLTESKQDLRNAGDQVSQLEGIAKARYGLSIVAEWMVKVCIQNEAPFDPRIVNRLITTARDVCSNQNRTGPRLVFF